MRYRIFDTDLFRLSRSADEATCNTLKFPVAALRLHADDQRGEKRKQRFKKRITGGRSAPTGPS
jgi:hypothetical protein